MNQKVQQGDNDRGKEEEFLREKKKLQSQLTKKFKKLQNKEQEILKNLKECAQWAKVYHEGELIKFHFASIKKGASSIVVQDWITDQPYHLKLNPAKTPQEEMAARFRRAKKLQAGIVPLTQYLERIQKELFHVEQKQQELHRLKILEELSSFKNALSPLASKHSRAPTAPSAISSCYKEYQSVKGIKIWVGKNAKGNDRLTFQLARGRDWWLHVKGWSGSHVIIRLKKDQDPDYETLQDAMQLALYHSKARAQGEGEICFTQCRYVSRLRKGKPGQVQVSKHQTAWVRFDQARYEALL
jgi:predicted ribosome quality control (RQC) complex YloA/Tae2 family protein